MAPDKKTIGIRLKKARQLLGLSMDQLVSRTGNQVTKGAISKYEMGEYLPREDKMRLLIDALGISEDYYYKTINYEATVTSMRSKTMLSEREKQMLLELMLLTLERTLELEDTILHVNRPKVEKLHFEVLREPEDAEIAAEYWRLNWRVGDYVVGGLYALLELHGIVVHEIDSTIDFDGFTAIINEKIPVFVINSNRNVERRRFTALHELAHLILSFDENASEFLREKLCNRFAGAALIPGSVMKKLLGTKRDNLFQEELIILRNTWGVSIQSLAHRAYELGIINQSVYGRIRESLAGNPLETGLGAYQGNEHSRLFEGLTLRAVSQRLITQSKASELLQMPGSELKDRLLQIW